MKINGGGKIQLSSRKIVAVICIFIVLPTRTHQKKITNSKKTENVSSVIHQGEISNLQEVLQSFEFRHCLIVVSRFETVDIVGVTSPTILRSFKSVADVTCHIPCLLKVSWSLDNIVGNRSHSLNCTSPKFFYNSPLEGDLNRVPLPYCTEIILVPFSSASKPWQCELEVSLFLPIARFSIPGGSKTLEYPGPIEYYARAPLVPRTYVLVEDDQSAAKVNYPDLCEQITYSGRSRRDTTEVMAWNQPGNFYVSILTKKMPRNKSRSLRSVQLYQNCKWKAEVPLEEFGYIESTNCSQEGMHVWENLDTLSGFKKGHDFEMQQCITPNILHIAIAKTGGESRAHRIPKVQAYILQTILKNFSYAIGDKIQCESDKGYLNIRNGDSPYNRYRSNIFRSNPYPLFSEPVRSMFYMNDTSSAVVFVTTNTRGLSALPFIELCNVFEPSVWIISGAILILSGLALALLLGQKRSRGTWRQIYSLMKCLLEQGDPYSPAVSDSNLVKVTLAGIFAATILLSNAYKNNNVYNMVVSRKTLQYHTIGQLENANFAIHTREFRMFHFHMPRMEEESNHADKAQWKVDKWSSYVLNMAHITVYLVTEIQNILKDVKLFDGDLGQLSRMADKVTLPAKYLELVREKVENQTKYPKEMYWNEWSRITEELGTFVVEQEEKSLISVLLDGSKVAVLLPISAGIRLKNLLESYSKRLYAGEERLTSGILAFNITGPIEFPIIRRIWAMRESGLMDWLHRLFDDTRRLHAKRYETVKPAVISGNILVIFVVWSTGIGISLITVATELSWHVVKRVDMKSYISNTVLVPLSFLKANIWNKVTQNPSPSARETWDIKIAG